MAYVSSQTLNSWTSSLSQKIPLVSRMAATAQKIRTLGNVVKKASALYKDGLYKNVQADVQKEHGGFKGWISKLCAAKSNAAGNFSHANQVRGEAESKLSRLGFLVGGSLEKETEHPKHRDRLLKQLMDANLYSKTQSSQLDLLPAATKAIGHVATRPKPSLQETTDQVMALTKKLDDLLKNNSALNHNDAQQAFYLRDSLSGLIRTYIELKRSLPEIPEEHKAYIGADANKKILERAVGYANWSTELKNALGIA